jgi:phosphatidylglycerophosphate synthase
MMNLHKTTGPSDWATRAPAQHNCWQRIAAKTNGLITPANGISLSGAAVTLIGLSLLSTNIWLSLVLITVGRVADIADGMVADKTGTKSALGEAIDATIDKVLLTAALLALFVFELVANPIIFAVAALAAVNSLISLLARKQQIAIHPTLAGKLSTAACWLALLALPVAHYLNEQGSMYGQIFLITGLFAFGATLLLGIQSTLSYYQQYRSGNAQ